MEAGAQVGGYRIIHSIGEGGMGTVYVAEHTTLGRRAAIKMLHPMFSTRADIVTRFCNEARAASAITDPGIIQIFDVGQHTDGSAYIVMELLEGEPLDRRLRQHRTLPVDAALRIVRQVAKSLGAAHARGIVHRDLKPENIFLVPDTEVIGGERAKILDFGIAKLLGDTNLKTQTSAVMGTPAYMSPEQCRGAGSVDERTDIYSLGCVLFTLLAGRPPFDAEGAGELIAMQLREPPPALSSIAPDVSPELDALVARCLQKNPAHRFSSGSELAAAISQLAAQPAAPVAAPLPTAPAHVAQTTLSTAAGTVRPTPSRKMSIAAVSAVAMLAAGAVLVPVVRSSSDSPAAETPSRPASSPPAATPPAATPPAATPPEPPAVTEPAATTAQAPPAKPGPPLAPSPPPLPSPSAPPAVAARPSESRPEPSAASPGGPAASHRSAPLQKETSEKPADAGTRPATQASRDKKPANASGSAPRTAAPAAAEPKQPAAQSPASDLPEKLDRSMILRGMAIVRRSIDACGTGFPGTQVRLSVTVAPDGTVSNVVVKGSPDAWLSSCLSTRTKLARFTPTRSGGAFGQSLAF